MTPDPQSKGEMETLIVAASDLAKAINLSNEPLLGETGRTRAELSWIRGSYGVHVPALVRYIRQLERDKAVCVEALKGYRKYEEEEYGHFDSPAHQALSRLSDAE